MADPTPVSRAAFPRIASLYRFQWETAQNGYVLLFPEGMVQLNGAAGEILRRCDGKRCAADIIADLKREFQAEEIDADVVAFLQAATQDGWVEWRDAGQP
ncbi:MAG: pyrroloquinoline quinone biosynthesis peptide chaperone PqqD [Steroidobacteraceae bacterium]